MQKQIAKSLFIFRRDLRLNDNTALLHALAHSQEVIPCFIFDPRQVGKNSYKSHRCVEFMIECLQDLDADLQAQKSKLLCLYGKAEEIVERLLQEEEIDAVFFNKDYTPFSKERDTAIAQICETKGCLCLSFDDLLLTPPGSLLNTSSKPYKVFTPFYKAALSIPVKTPQKNNFNNYVTSNFSTNIPTVDLKKNVFASNDNSKNSVQKKWGVGGRKKSKKILQQLGKLENYEVTRNFPYQNTSYLSAYNKFGTHSIREILIQAHKVFGPNSTFVKQLYWRDFFTHLIYHFPHVLQSSFQEKYDAIQWIHSKEKFEKWCQGMTGFPIVDAGMRQLNKTGYMHNRARMITASFLVKDLHIDWKYGEKYFAQNLVDYDVAVNNGSWQWAASTGADAQPYFRIFNPWLQQKKYDPDCIYIKQWIPELQHISTQQIHTWYRDKHPHIKNYPRPMVDHAEAARYAKKLFASTKKTT